METSDPESSPPPSRIPPVALVLINRPDDGLRTLCLEAEDLRLLKQVLNWAGYKSVVVDIDDDVDRISDSVVVYKPTVIVNLVEHMYGELHGAPVVAGMLDLFGYVYTGSEPRVLLDCQDWHRTQILLEHAGLPSLSALAARHLHACVLGNETLEHLPICESLVIEGETVVEPCSLAPHIAERIGELSSQVWKCLGLRDVAQIDYDLSPAGRVSIVRVVAAVDIFGPVFRAAAAGREGGMPGTIVKLCHLCHLRLPPEELQSHPLP